MLAFPPKSPTSPGLPKKGIKKTYLFKERIKILLK